MATAVAPITVAISAEFLRAMEALPKGIQKRVREFIELFRENPASPGINYEKITGAADANMRSARVDQAYRAIVLKPETGDVYVLLWVDHHDDAYQWARNRKASVHPDTGSLQIIKVDYSTELRPEAPAEPMVAGLFDAHRDRELVRLGVPEELIPLVRSLQSERDLDNAGDDLPTEAYEALFLLAAGYSVEAVDRELQRARTPEPVDTSDFASALANPESKQRFYVVENEEELNEMLDAPLEQWRVFLHPTQRKLVETTVNGPMRVLGGAGTGKTVVAMHRARRLAEQLEGDARLLFTTFTTNLAADIAANLTKICSQEVMRRIDVVNIDRWVGEFLRSQGYEFEIDYGTRSRDLWERALNLAPSDLEVHPSFYREEWERIVQPNGITTLDAYLKVSRVGRGIAVNRAARQKVWPVFEEYRALLTEHGLKEGDDAMRDACSILEQKGDILPFSSIVVDEAQDMGAQAFRLIRQMIPGGDRPNDLFIVGDAHQRIYRHKVVLGHCGVNVRGRSRKLRINYRTTEETRRWATGLLEGRTIDDLDGGTDTTGDTRSLLHGAPPEVHAFDDFSKEVDFVIHRIQQLSDDEQSSVCVVARENKIVDQFESQLQAAGIETYRLHRSESEDRARAGVRLATMHRVKGLEFEYVIIVGADDETIPSDRHLDPAASTAEKEEHELRERALLYVSATRARRGVNVTCTGKMSRFLST